MREFTLSTVISHPCTNTLNVLKTTDLLDKDRLATIYCKLRIFDKEIITE